MTSLSWENWVTRYAAHGYSVVASSWPGMDGDIEQLRRDPSAIATLGIETIVDHYEKIIRNLDSPPLIVGHSFGGLITQILLDRGLGAAGVAITLKPCQKHHFSPFIDAQSIFPGAEAIPPTTTAPLPLSPEQFHYAFTNNLSEQESLAVYERYAVPGPDHVLFQATFANFNPHAATAVDFHNDRRAPLLLISGGSDHVSPAAVVEEQISNYNS